MLLFVKRIYTYIRFLRSLIVANFRLLPGLWKLTRIPKLSITFFGGSRVTMDSPYAKRATKLAKLLIFEDFSIITGGGPGIMAAANKGASEALKKTAVKKRENPISLGISLISFSHGRFNRFVNEKILMKYFFARKWLLVRDSVGFIVFPGGFGTLDELFEILTLEQTDRMKELPIILMDKDYWEPIVNWLKSRPLSNKLISKKDLDLFYLTDSIDEALDIIKKYCKINRLDR